MGLGARRVGADGARLGRWSLRIDAAYCAVLGVGVAAFAAPIAEGIALSPTLIAAIGVAVVVWAGAVLWMLARLPLRTALRLVMVANLLAAVAVSFASAAAATLLAVLTALAVAIDVAAFAGSQWVAIRRLAGGAALPAPSASTAGGA